METQVLAAAGNIFLCCRVLYWEMPAGPFSSTELGLPTIILGDIWGSVHTHLKAEMITRPVPVKLNCF